MRIGRVLTLLIAVLALMDSICAAEMTAMSLQERLRQSDLVIVGEILKSENTGIVKEEGVENWLAECKVKRYIKQKIHNYNFEEAKSISIIDIAFEQIPARTPVLIKLSEGKEYLLFLKETEGRREGRIIYEMITSYHGAFEAGKDYLIYDEQSPEFPKAVTISFDAIVSRLTNDLLLTIKSDKEVYQAGEEIKLTLDFKNIGAKSVWLLKEMLPNADLELRLYKVEGKNKQDVSPPVKIDVIRQILAERDFKEIFPQETFLKEMRLRDFSERLTLSKGHYEVVIEFNLHPSLSSRFPITPWSGRLVSNTIAIEIKDKENTALPSNLSFLSDVKEFQEFRLQMTETEIKEIVQRNSLVLEGNSRTGFLVRNRDGQTLALSMSDGRCAGIQRLPRQPSLQELMKSLPKDSDLLPLAKQALYQTNRIMSAKAGEMSGDPPEITAFNIIYHSDKPAEIFKEVYKKGRTAAKFYALIGLYLLKDKGFEKLKTDFLNNEQEKIYCQYGCKVSQDNDAKQVLNIWLEGMPKGLWYTKIVTDKALNKK